MSFSCNVSHADTFHPHLMMCTNMTTILSHQEDLGPSMLDVKYEGLGGTGLVTTPLNMAPNLSECNVSHGGIAQHHIYYKLILLKSVCLSVLANCRSQFLLHCRGRCIKLFIATDSTSCHEFAPQFGLAFFYMRKTPKKTIAKVSRKLLLNERP